MVITMSRDQDPITRKDGKRLSKINLNEEEWDAIKKLIKVLEPFASETELLEGSKYATISFMYDAITEIKNGVYSTEKERERERERYDTQNECINLTDYATVYEFNE